MKVNAKFVTRCGCSRIVAVDVNSHMTPGDIHYLPLQPEVSIRFQAKEPTEPCTEVRTFKFAGCEHSTSLYPTPIFEETK